MKKKVFLFFFALLLGLGFAGTIVQPQTVYAEEPNRIVQVDNERDAGQTSSGLIETKKKNRSVYDPFEGFKGGDWTKFDLKSPAGMGLKEIFTGSGILGWIIDWITYGLIGIMQFFAKMGGDLTKIDAKGYFTNDAMKTMQMFFYDFALFCLAVGIIFSAMDTAVQYQNGSGNIGNTVSGIIKAVFFTLGFIVIIPELYRGAVDASGVIIGDGISDTIGNIMQMFFSTSVLSVVTIGIKPALSLIFIVIFVIMYIKHLYAICKRALVLLSFMAKGSVMPFALARNSTSAFTSYANEFIMFLLGCILQEWAFYNGAAILADGKLLAGFALITCSNEVFSYLGTVRADGENVLHDMHDLVCTATNIGRGVAGLATGGAATAVAGTVGSVTKAATQGSSSEGQEKG